MKRKATLILAILSTVLVAVFTAQAAQFFAEVQFGNGLEEDMVLTVFTYEMNPANHLQEVEMEYVPADGDDPEYWFAEFAPQILAFHWGVMATPSDWFDPNIILDDDFVIGSNSLDDPFIYVGPIR